MDKKPHPMDDCFFCPCPRFKHEGILGKEERCLSKDCFCIGFTWTEKQ